MKRLGRYSGRVRQAGSRRRTAGGFTLVELLVVVVILMVIFSVAAYAWQGLRERSRVQQTRSMLQTLNAAYTEYQAQRPRGYQQIYHNDPDRAEAIGEDSYSIDWFLHEASRLDEVAEIIEGVGNDFVDRDPESDEVIMIYDIWGTPVEFRNWSDQDDAVIYPWDVEDPETGEEIYFPERSRGYFASAGPSRAWGDPEGDEVQQRQAEDNIYSFELDE